MTGIALLVVDVQNALMAENPYNGEALIHNIVCLIDT